MSLHGYEFQSVFAKKHAAQGFKEAFMQAFMQGLREGQRKILTKLLTLQFAELPDAILQQIQAADDKHLERWTEPILVARTIDDVFAD